MTADAIHPGNHHGTVVARDRDDGLAGILLLGPTGSGKSDLALRLIDRGWRLVADDRVDIALAGDRPSASVPPPLAGKLAIAGIGIADVASLPAAPLSLVVQIERDPPAFPMDRQRRTVCGVAIPTLKLNAFWPSAPILIERAIGMTSGATQ